MAKPFLKWVGGKTQLLPELRRLLPPVFGAYFEPFLGGGALFFDLEPERAILSDRNLELVGAYRHVRDNLEEVVNYLEAHEVGLRGDLSPQSYYLRQREIFNEGLADAVSQAARMIFLNKACFNGLWRVNKSGEFNVPWNKNPKATVLQREKLEAASRALQNARILGGDYREALALVRPGDFVYFDPPYAPASKTADFVGFTKEGFTLEDQEALAVFAERLAEDGAFVMLSNADTPFVRKLYRDFQIHEVEAMRSVNSDTSNRKGARELIIQGGYAT